MGAVPTDDNATGAAWGGRLALCGSLAAIAETCATGLYMRGSGQGDRSQGAGPVGRGRRRARPPPAGAALGAALRAGARDARAIPAAARAGGGVAHPLSAAARRPLAASGAGAGGARRGGDCLSATALGAGTRRALGAAWQQLGAARLFASGADPARPCPSDPGAEPDLAPRAAPRLRSPGGAAAGAAGVAAGAGRSCVAAPGPPAARGDAGVDADRGLAVPAPHQSHGTS